MGRVKPSVPYETLKKKTIIKTIILNPSKMLMLIHKEECPFCHKVRQFMSENEISYISLVSKTGSKSRKILEALGGKSQVPFLIDFDAGEYMYESDGIIEYLKMKQG